MRTQEELNQLQDDIKNGEIDENQCRDICYALILELLTTKDMEPRSEVQWFSGEMERALRDNDYKRGWHNKDHQYLLSKLQKAIERIEHEINDLDPDSGKPCDILVIKEAVHAANFAMIIADNMRNDR
jgi:hypothetical protein